MEMMTVMKIMMPMMKLKKKRKRGRCFFLLLVLKDGHFFENICQVYRHHWTSWVSKRLLKKRSKTCSNIQSR